MSIGIAEYQKNEEIEQFVHRADLAMYKSKGKGGNKIAIAAKIIELPSSLNVEPSYINS